MRAVWRVFVTSPSPKHAAVAGVHLVVDLDTMRPWCGCEGELQPALQRPAGMLPACVDCLEFAEWMINRE